MRSILPYIVISLAATASASFVRLEPSTNTEYLATIPVNSNGIIGVGMGKEGGYSFLRGEDVDWIAEAIRERQNGAGGTSIWHPQFTFAGKLPRERVFIDGETITNMFFGGTARITGFVRSDFAPVVHDQGHSMAGEAILCTNAACAVNGTNVFDDIRVIFSGGKTFTPEEYPKPVSLSGFVTFSTVTNCYDVLEDGTLFTTLATLQDDYYYWKDKTNRTVTAYDYTTSLKSTYVRLNRVYYMIEDEQNYYFDGYTAEEPEVYNNSYPTTFWAMYAKSERYRMFYTYASVKKTSVSTYKGGKVYVCDPIETSDNFETCFPTNGSPFYVEYDLITGRENDALAYNTNVTIRAYVVTCWKFTDETSVYEQDGIYGSSTNYVVESDSTYFLTVNDVGPMNRIQDYMWRSTVGNSAEIIGNAVVFLHRKGIDIEHVDIQNPAFYDKDHFPSSSPVNSRDLTSWKRTTRTKNLEPSDVRVLLVVKPTWRTRVIRN